MAKRYCKQVCSGKDSSGLCVSASECPMFDWDIRKEQGDKPMETEIPSEAEEQEELFAWCLANGIEMVHIPNERKCSAFVAGQLLRQGLRKGFPDNFFPIASKGFHGLFIELKRAKKALSKKSPEQRDWIKKLNEMGYKAVFCYGAEEAKKVVLEYLGRVLNAESRTTARNMPILSDNVSVGKSIDKNNKTRINANKQAKERKEK